jgi:hypothetical protein
MSSNTIMEDKKGRACGTQGEKINEHRVLVRKSKGGRPLATHRRVWEDNFKMYLNEERGMDSSRSG